jgi:hypothetical protein
MNHFASVILAFALAMPALAQDTKTNVPESNPPSDVQMTGQFFPASAAILSAPLVLTNDYFYLVGDQSEVAKGGSAIFNFNITNAGNYVIETLVNAPDESSNSFFLNIDAQPEDPAMIWDIAVTSGFEKRTVSWRGNSDSSSDEIDPKRFKLAPGAHKLIIVGREPGTLLKSLTIRPAPPQ